MEADFAKVVEERDQLYDSFEGAVRAIQQKSDFRWVGYTAGSISSLRRLQSGNLKIKSGGEMCGIGGGVGTVSSHVEQELLRDPVFHENTGCW